MTKKKKSKKEEENAKDNQCQISKKEKYTNQKVAYLT